MKILPQICMWTRKNWLNFESHAPLDPDPGIFWRILQHCRIGHFSTIWFISPGETDYENSNSKISLNRKILRVILIRSGGLRTPNTRVYLYAFDKFLCKWPYTPHCSAWKCRLDTYCNWYSLKDIERTSYLSLYRPTICNMSFVVSHHVSESLS